MWSIILGIISGVILALLWHYNLTLFGLGIVLILLCALFFIDPLAEEEDLSDGEVRERIQEQVRESLDRSLRKHKVKYIENALAAYNELYGKDEFYQEIWKKVYENFYKEK